MVLKSTKLTILLTLIVTFSFTSCATLGGNKTVPLYNPTFSNELPTQPNTEQYDITIALLEPSFALENANRPRPRSQITSTVLYKYMISRSDFGVQFQDAMGGDFQETLTQKGFTIKGPYAGYESMVYSDRKNSDLILGSTIKIYPVVTSLNYESVLIPTGFRIKNSTARLGGQISLAIYEPMTQTKLWTRSIPIPDNTFQFNGTTVWQTKPKVVFMKRERQFRNGMAKALENAYSDIFDTIWRFLNPAEMKHLKEQAMEIRKDAGFDIK